MYCIKQHPNASPQTLSAARVYEVPELGKKAMMVCIPTTSGTGSEVTPFSVVTDEITGHKYPLVSLETRFQCRRKT